MPFGCAAVTVLYARNLGQMKSKDEIGGHTNMMRNQTRSRASSSLISSFTMRSL